MPTAAPAAARGTTSSARPCAITTCAPDCVASRAASSFVHHPAGPAPPRLAARRRLDRRVDALDALDQPRPRVVRRVGRVEAVGVGQDQQQVRVDQVGDLRREVVVVPDQRVLDLLDRDHVVLDHDRHDVELQQRQQSVARVQVALPVDEVRARQQRLRRGDPALGEQLVPVPEQPRLPDGGEHLPPREVLRPRRPRAEAVAARRDRARGHHDHLAAARADLRHLVGDRGHHRAVEALRARRQQVRAALQHQPPV